MLKRYLQVGEDWSQNGLRAVSHGGGILEDRWYKLSPEQEALRHMFSGFKHQFNIAICRLHYIVCE
jgi:hypothetical protein